ncbi:hypothetical protein SDC9_76259 [bioreactor metagenome]|uniref:Uncharacterized protein n=1 Tax=bioreactor metagenome TaxID=1076179 RepID=A0A644YN41_9ZZZZ
MFRVDDGVRIRQGSRQFVMVGNNDVDPHFFCHRYWFVAGNPVIASQDQLRPVFDQFFECGSIWAIPIREAIRQIIADIAAQHFDRFHKYAGTCDTIRIVVPVNDDFLSRFNSFSQAMDRFIHIVQQIRIMEFHFGPIDESCDLFFCFQSPLHAKHDESF